MYNPHELKDAAVGASSRNIVVINVQIGPDQLDEEADEYALTINGQPVCRIGPIKARRLGLI